MTARKKATKRQVKPVEVFIVDNYAFTELKYAIQCHDDVNSSGDWEDECIGQDQLCAEITDLLGITSGEDIVKLSIYKTKVTLTKCKTCGNGHIVEGG